MGIAGVAGGGNTVRVMEKKDVMAERIGPIAEGVKEADEREAELL